MKFWVLGNKSLRIGKINESDVFFLLENGSLSSLGIPYDAKTFNEEEERDEIYSAEFEIEWNDLDKPVNLKIYYELLKKYDNFENNFRFYKSKNQIIANNDKTDISSSLMFLFLKMIDLVHISNYSFDIVQKFRYSSFNTDDLENEIKTANESFSKFILSGDNDFNVNEQKLEFNLLDLRKKLKDELSNQSKENEKKIEDLKEEIKIAEEELKTYSEELHKISNAIDKLNVPADVMKKSKKNIEGRIDFFNKYAGYILKIFVPVYSVLVLLSLMYLIVEKTYSINLVLYFTLMFPLIFSTVLSFLLYRQSNIKMKELQEIDKRFILIHEIKQSLKALIEVNMGKNMKRKTEKVIDKLIDNILEYSSSSITGKKKGKSENSINEILSGLANLKTVTS